MEALKGPRVQQAGRRTKQMASAVQFERAQTSAGTAADEQLCTIEEIAELLNVPVSWVYGRTRSRTVDRLPGFRLGKYWRFRKSDVLAWLETQCVGVRRHA